MARRLDARDPNFEAEFTGLISAKRETEEDVAQAVRAIIADVRARGDAALIELSKKFDRVELSPENLRARRCGDRGCRARLPGPIAEGARCRRKTDRGLSPPPIAEG